MIFMVGIRSVVKCRSYTLFLYHFRGVMYSENGHIRQEMQPLSSVFGDTGQHTTLVSIIIISSHAWKSKQKKTALSAQSLKCGQTVKNGVRLISLHLYYCIMREPEK